MKRTNDQTAQQATVAADSSSEKMTVSNQLNLLSLPLSFTERDPSITDRIPFFTFYTSVGVMVKGIAGTSDGEALLCAMGFLHAFTVYRSAPFTIRSHRRIFLAHFLRPIYTSITGALVFLHFFKVSGSAPFAILSQRHAFFAAFVRPLGTSDGTSEGDADGRALGAADGSEDGSASM